MGVQDWSVVIGLEVHCQLRTETKMFSGASFAFGEAPNTQVDPYTVGLPGTLPVPNRKAVDAAIKLGLATRSKLHLVSRFARKHYFYPDLPKGYQITQSDHPYATEGEVEIPVGDAGETRTIRLVRIHMEEDAGKNMHVPGEDTSLVDYNRAGAPLLEIVSEPDVRTAAEAAAYMRELRTIIRYLDISDANMEEGTLRCDANVSIRRDEGAPFGTRCEIKNLNSFKFLEAAINAEIRRQVDILESGGEVIQSTLSYDPGRDLTRVMRTKEEAADYRYFPEPDLPPLLLTIGMIEAVRRDMPELPASRRRRYVELGLSHYDAGVLTADAGLAAYFDAALEAGAPAKSGCNWVTGELLARLNADGKQISQAPLRPEWIAELVALVDEGTISNRVAKDVFERAWNELMSPRAIVERDGLRQVSDTSALRTTIEDIFARSPAQLEQYRSGKSKIRGYFVGQVMKATKGQANPQVVNELLDEMLPAQEETP